MAKHDRLCRTAYLAGGKMRRSAVRRALTVCHSVTGSSAEPGQSSSLLLSSAERSSASNDRNACERTSV